jgi:TRAP-type C4-dicarboxylate transport system permease small subunit
MNITIILIIVIVILLIGTVVVLIIRMISKKTPVPKIYTYIELGTAGLALLIAIGAIFTARSKVVAAIPVVPV